MERSEWTEEEYLRQAKERCSASTYGDQVRLIETIRSMDEVDLRFDGTGPANATYDVCVAGTELRLLWIYSDGSIWVDWEALVEAGFDDVVTLWKNEWSGLIKPENQQTSRSKMGLDALEIESLAQKLERVAVAARAALSRTNY